MSMPHAKKVFGRHDTSVSFKELATLVRSLGLSERNGTNHRHIFTGTSAQNQPIFINIQPAKNGEAKRYQVEQVRNIIKSLNL